MRVIVNFIIINRLKKGNSFTFPEITMSEFRLIIRWWTGVMCIMVCRNKLPFSMPNEKGKLNTFFKTAFIQ